MKWFVLFLALMPCMAYSSDDYDPPTGEGSFFKYGLGLKTEDQKSISEVKMFSIGRQSPFLYILDQKWEVGMWSDVHGNGRKSSGFGGWSMGIEPKLGSIYVHSFWGVVGITTTDSMLGSHFQFMQDLGLGVRDVRGVGLGVGYKHISDAGIKQPNKGRDFFFAQLQIPF